MKPSAQRGDEGVLLSPHPRRQDSPQNWVEEQETGHLQSFEMGAFEAVYAQQTPHDDEFVRPAILMQTRHPEPLTYLAPQLPETHEIQADTLEEKVSQHASEPSVPSYHHASLGHFAPAQMALWPPAGQPSLWQRRAYAGTQPALFLDQFATTTLRAVSGGAEHVSSGRHWHGSSILSYSQGAEPDRSQTATSTSRSFESSSSAVSGSPLLSPNHFGGDTVMSPAAMTDSLVTQPSFDQTVFPARSSIQLDRAPARAPSTSTAVSDVLPAPVYLGRPNSKKPYRASERRQDTSTWSVAGNARRQIEVVEVSCLGCLRPLATLNLRGTAAELEFEYVISYRCLECTVAQRTATTTADTVSPAGLIGTDFSSSASKKRQRPLNKASRIACDVCLRDIATGSLHGVDSDETAPFGTEIICHPCTKKYKRCSDCGGGGGGRLGVGKWRSREVFHANRKTCKLNHQRQGSVSDAEYLCGRVGELPSGERPSLMKECASLFEHSLLSSLATPEVLETAAARVSTYQDVCELIKQGWKRIAESAVVPAVSDDTRRYIGIRRARPNVRKKQAQAAQQAARAAELSKEAGPSGSWLSEHKGLVAFTIAEWDKLNGTLFFPVAIPFPASDTSYEGSSTLMTVVGNRAALDRQQQLVSLMLAPQTAQQAEHICPPIRHIWTMLFYDKSARVISFLQKRGGFLLLQEYLRMYPEVSREWFPPYREVDVPTEEQGHWTILVKDHLSGLPG